MLSHIKHWLSLSEKAPLPATPNSELLVHEPESSTSGDIETTGDGVEAFLNACGLTQRDDVLSKHPFWQRPSPMLGIDAATCHKILEHILDINEHYVMALRFGSPAFSSGLDEFDDQDMRIRAMKGIIWGTPKEYMAWQRQAVVLAENEPTHAIALLDVVRQQVLFNAGDANKEWPNQAEHLLNHGGSLTVSHVLASLQKSVAAEDLGEALVDAPNVSRLLHDPQYDQDALAWAALHEKNRHWLTTWHPRLSAWDIAERLRDPKTIAALAEFTHDGAVLKAWYGVPLTSQEIACHPLAYSLYVHKHAPIYMEEAQPLPETWSMALLLCTAGVDFKNMLLMAAKTKKSPQLQPEHIILPDLGFTL